jgi:hypothetical protein
VTSSGNPGPRSGDDTFDLIDDARATLAERRRVRFGDDLAAMTLVAGLIEQAERRVPTGMATAELTLSDPARAACPPERRAQGRPRA